MNGDAPGPKNTFSNKLTLWKIWSVSLKWFICLSEFEPLGPIKYLERQEVLRDFNYFLQVQVSQALNRKSPVCTLHGKPHRRTTYFSAHHWATFIEMNRAPSPWLCLGFDVTVIDPAVPKTTWPLQLNSDTGAPTLSYHHSLVKFKQKNCLVWVWGTELLTLKFFQSTNVNYVTHVLLCMCCNLM